MLAFEVERPLTLSQALAILGEGLGAAVPKAGGTDLLVWIKSRAVLPKVVVDLGLIDELRCMEFRPGEGLKLGALVTCNEVVRSEEVQTHYPALWEACRRHSDWQIRSRATVVGNVCSAVPSGDTMPALYCYGAVVHLVGPRGERDVPIDSFVRGPRVKDLRHDELVSHIFVPDPGRNAGCYLKLGRRNALDIAQVGVACVALRSGEGVEYRIGLGAVAPTPLRALEAEEMLRGHFGPNDALLERAASAASAASRPISDVRASAEYRRAMVGELVKEAVRIVSSRLVEG